MLYSQRGKFPQKHTIFAIFAWYSKDEYFFSTYVTFPPQHHFAMGSLVQISSGAIRCSFNTTFRARFCRILKSGSGRFWRKRHRRRTFQRRYWGQVPKVPAQKVLAQKVPAQKPNRSGSGADIEVRFRTVPAQSLGEAYGRFWVEWSGEARCAFKQWLQIARND